MRQGTGPTQRRIRLFQREITMKTMISFTHLAFLVAVALLAIGLGLINPNEEAE